MISQGTSSRNLKCTFGMVPHLSTGLSLLLWVFMRLSVSQLSCLGHGCKTFHMFAFA